ncbi:MAG: hypothetical protein V1835_02605 [Candidatus Micrarchaeota archaeon]
MNKILTLALLLFSSALVCAGDFRIIQLTNNSFQQILPAIHGNYVAYEDNRNGGTGGTFDIYRYDLGTKHEAAITNTLPNQRNSAIYSNLIVYEDYNGYDIMMYNITDGQTTRVSTDIATASHPSIHGDIAAWDDLRSGHSEIYYSNISTHVENLLSPQSGVIQTFPAVYGTKIAWQDMRNGNYDIYVKDIATGIETRVTSDPTNQMYPAISGSRIVWQDPRSTNKSIYLYELPSGPERKITPDYAIPEKPSIYGDLIIWQDQRNGNWDLFMYNLSSNAETQLTNDPNFQGDPAVYGSSIAWNDFRNSDWNVYFGYWFLCGDIFRDDTILTSDISILSAIWREVAKMPVWWRNGDMDGDGKITIADIWRLLDNFKEMHVSTCETVPNSPSSVGINLRFGAEAFNGTDTVLPAFIEVSSNAAISLADLEVLYDNTTLQLTSVKKTARTSGMFVDSLSLYNPSRKKIAIHNYTNWNQHYSINPGSGSIVGLEFKVLNPSYSNPTLSKSDLFDDQLRPMPLAAYVPIPAISAIAASTPTLSSAEISWLTDTPSNSTLLYGTSPGTYSNTEIKNENVLSHIFSIANLQLSTAYFFILTSCNGFGCGNSSERNFTTGSIDYPLFVYLNSPQNGFSTFSTSVDFNCTAEDENNLTGMEGFVWGPKSAGGGGMASGPSYTLSFTAGSLTPGNYEWNCRGTDSLGNQNYSIVNYTFQVLTPTYSFAITPTTDKFPASNKSGTLVNRTYYLNNTGNQNLTGISCNANVSWAQLLCPSTLKAGNNLPIFVKFNTSDLGEKVYGVRISFTHAQAGTASVVIDVNVSENPYYPPPVISGLNVTPSYSSAIVRWNTTGTNSNSSATYGTNSSNLTMAAGLDDNVEAHIITLMSLAPSTQYYYFVQSCSFGSCSSSSIASFNTTVTPPGCAYANPPCGAGQSCQNNVCISGSPGGGGGCSNCGGGGSGGIPPTTPTSSPSPSARASPSPTVSANTHILQLRDEFTDALPELSESDAIDIQELLKQAELLEKEGKKEQALVLVGNARRKLTDALDKVKGNKASFTWPVAIVLIIVVLGFGGYYVYNMRKKDAEIIEEPKPELKTAGSMNEIVPETKSPEEESREMFDDITRGGASSDDWLDKIKKPLPSDKEEKGGFVR